MQVTQTNLRTPIVDGGGFWAKGWSDWIIKIGSVLTGSWSVSPSTTICSSAKTCRISQTPYCIDVILTFGTIDLSSVILNLPSVSGGFANILLDNSAISNTIPFSGSSINLVGVSIKSAVVFIHAISGVDK